MKKTVIQLLAVCLFFTLNSEAKIQQSPFVKYEKLVKTTDMLLLTEEGGISSGGGGTLPAHPISQYEVYRVVSDAKRELRLFIRSMQRWAPDDFIGLAKKYFYGENNLATVLEKTDLEVITDQACHDSQGNEVDASIYGSKPNTVCLSASRIAPKLIKERAHIEIEALLLHELSHLLGANEKEARDLQEYTAYLLESLNHESIQQESWDLVYFVDDIKAKISSLASELKNLSVREIHVRMDQVEDLMRVFETKSGRNHLSLFNYQDLAYYEIQNTRFYMAGIFIGAQLPPFTSQGGEPNYYENSFGGASEISIAELAKNQGNDYLAKNIYASERIKKLEKNTDLIPLLEQLSEYFSEQRELAAAMAYNGPIPHLNGPWRTDKTNPWIQFIGKYDVSLIGCTSSLKDPEYCNKDLKSFEIYSDPKYTERIWVKESKENSWGTDGYYNNAGDIWGGAVVSVVGNTSFAERSAEQGTRWYEDQQRGWQKRLTRLSLENNEFRLTQRSEYFQAKMGQPAISNYSQCEFRLNKKN